MKIELLSLDKIDPCQLSYHANDPLVSRYLRNNFPYPYTLDHAMSFITHSLEHHTLDLGIVVDGICIGCIGVTFPKDVFIKDCELGYWIGRQYWGQGITTQVVHMMCKYLFENFSIHKIYADVYGENCASTCVLEKNHFVMEGCLVDHVYKDESYHDLLLYGLRRNQLYGN